MSGLCIKSGSITLPVTLPVFTNNGLVKCKASTASFISFSEYPSLYIPAVTSNTLSVPNCLHPPG